MKKNVVILFLFSLLIITCTILGHNYYINKLKNKNVIKLYGNIDIRQVNLSFRVGGRIKNLIAEEGDKVKKGQLLAVLEDDQISNKLKQAEAQIKIVEAKKHNIDLYYDRNKDLCEKNLISKQECDNILSNKKEVDANYDYAIAMNEEAKIALNDCNLYAPSDGSILIKAQDEGAMVGVGSPIYTLSLNEKMYVKTYLDGKYLDQVKIGDKVEVYSNSKTKKYIGYISFISSTAEFTPKTIETETLRSDLVYRIKITIENFDDYLKHGMPVDVYIKK